MTLSFFSLDALKAFATENEVRCMYRAELIDAAKKSKMVAALEVAGFSEIVPAYEVDVCDGCYYLEGCSWVLRIIPTGEIFRVFEKLRGKFRLYMYERCYVRSRGFEFKQQEPNLIGKATEKKLTAWIDYLHMERTALVNYANSAMAANRSFADRFRAKFPDAVFRTCGDGWTDSFSFYWERFYIKYTANDRGTFSRQFEVCHSALPTDEEILG